MSEAPKSSQGTGGQVKGATQGVTANAASFLHNHLPGAHIPGINAHLMRHTPSGHRSNFWSETWLHLRISQRAGLKVGIQPASRHVHHVNSRRATAAHGPDGMGQQVTADAWAKFLANSHSS